jgi:hypothetical protein
MASIQASRSSEKRDDRAVPFWPHCHGLTMTTNTFYARYEWQQPQKWVQQHRSIRRLVKLALKA